MGFSILKSCIAVIGVIVDIDKREEVGGAYGDLNVVNQMKVDDVGIFQL